MADENPDSSEKRAADAPDPVALPTREAFPPPPEVTYQRPAPRSGGLPQSRPAEEDDPSRGQTAETGGSPYLKFGAGIAAATTFVASVIAGFLIGQWIDHRWNHAGGMPWGTLVFSLLGVAAGFLNLFRVLAATDRRGKK